MNLSEEFQGKTPRNIKLTIQYDGTNFNGWQSQKNANTIQGIIEETIKKITNENVTLRASGRTDAGVHAFRQVANFKTHSNIPLTSLQKAINSLLPDDISVISIEEVNGDFISLRSFAKCYLYRIIQTPHPLPLFKRYAMHVNRPLNIDAMKKASQFFLGVHDFSSFMASGSSVKTTIREVKYIKFTEKTPDILFPLEDFAKEINFLIVANGFLRKMVRNIMGLLLQIGLGKMEAEIVKEILNAKRRNFHIPPAEPNGLFLLRVFYDKMEMEQFLSKIENNIVWSN